MLGSYNSFKPESKVKNKILKIIKVIVILFIFYQFLSVFIISSFIVKTSAMEPGIIKGQRILSAPIISGASLNIINIKIPGIKDPSRGDIFLIKPANSEKLALYVKILDPVIRFFTLQKISLDSNISKNWNNQLAVKRIIGIPGDTVKMQEYKYFIKPSGKKEYIPEENIIDQEYIIVIPENISGMDSSFPFSGSMEEIKLSENQYFAANDNRGVSYDSRLYGSVSRNDILSPVFLSYDPGFSFK